MQMMTKKKLPGGASVKSTEYRGRQTKTGNSSGFRFEGALFRSHPEFNGDVVAHVIAPGRLLVTAETKKEEADPVMASFLAFLGDSIARSPSAIQPMDETLATRIERLVEAVETAPDEPLDDEVLL